MSNCSFMGEFFFKKLFVGFLFVVSLFFFMYSVKNNEGAISDDNNYVSSPVSDNLISGYAVHPLYSSFSAAEAGFVFSNVSNSVSVSDGAIYRVGYYSVNGSAWQSFSLSGSLYNGSADWLTGSVTGSLPFFGSAPDLGAYEHP
jgi:hypothetical protein